MNSEPRLVSFVLRFVYEEAPAAGPVGGPSGGLPRGETPGWHGVIRHVQSNSERHFTHWADAMGFIAEYVDVGEQPCQ